MNTLNHALWGATFGRIVGLPVEGAIMGALPDLPVPLLAYYHRSKGKKQLDQQPFWLASVYSTLHNWCFGLGLTAVLFFISPSLALLGMALAWHGIEDAFVHTDYATKFLYPLWNKKIKGYSATHHKWIQVVDLLLILIINILLHPVR